MIIRFLLNQKLTSMKNLIFFLSCILWTYSNAQDVKTGFAEVNGTQLYYEVAGQGEPILFVHGNFGDTRHWDYQFEPLAKKYKVIRYDVRGYGKSANPNPDEAYYDYEDILALLDFLKIDKVHICGVSMGSGIAVDFALVHPERCFSLIPVGPWAYGFGSGKYTTAAGDSLNVIFGKGVQGLNEEGIKAATDFWWTGTKFVKSSVRIQRTMDELLKMGYEYDYWGFKNQSKRRNAQPVAISRLSEIKLPTLIITAEYDLKPCIDIAEKMEKEIEGSKKISIKDAGHLMNMEKPDEFNAVLTEFIENL